MKVKNLIIGSITIVVIGVVVFFALKMTKELKNNNVNSMNAVEAESEEVVDDAFNTIEEGSDDENECSNDTKEDENTTSEDSNETEENDNSNGCGCGCGDDTGGCC